MPQVCKACAHPERAAINAGLIAGETHASLGRRFSIPSHSVTRHSKAHLTLVTTGVAGQELPQQVDLIQRLIDSLRDLEAVRQAALMSGNSSHVIRAAAVSNGLITTLLDKLGVDDLTIAEDLRTVHALALAVGSATRAHPPTGRLIADELRAHGLHDDATALDAVAFTAERKIREKEIEK